MKRKKNKMENKEFYVVEIDENSKKRAVKLRKGYEDSVCFYYRKDNVWIAVDKHTGLRLAIRNKKKDLENLIHSKVFERNMIEAIAIAPKQYEELCESYKDMVDSQNGSDE
jgi:hypothetical protein